MAHWWCRLADTMVRHCVCTSKRKTNTTELDKTYSNATSVKYSLDLSQQILRIKIISQSNHSRGAIASFRSEKEEGIKGVVLTAGSLSVT